MCLVVAMKVVKVNGLSACCEAQNTRRDVSLLLLEKERVQIGQYVLVQLGYATEIVSETYARESWQLLDEIIDALDAQNLSA